MRRTLLVAGLFILFLSDVTPQELTVMFYNTENLFDTFDDTLKDDNEFLPTGNRRWTKSRYLDKISSVAKVIVAAGGWESPALVGLCEVENITVAEDLAYSPLLASSSYRIVHRESPDRRGIDLCLLYRPDIFNVCAVRSWTPGMNEGEIFDSRSILYVKTSVGEDTLHVILCHWPSRRGGTLASDGLRNKMATLLRVKIDSLRSATSEGASVLVMGDFNATPEDDVMTYLCRDSCLVNMAIDESRKGRGSYKYQGMWEMIDQILVTPQLCQEGRPFRAIAGSFDVVDEPFLLDEDPDFPGRKPFPAYKGYTWAGGYSDHLPVLVRIRHQ